MFTLLPFTPAVNRQAPNAEHFLSFWTEAIEGRDGERLNGTVSSLFGLTAYC